MNNVNRLLLWSTCIWCSGLSRPKTTSPRDTESVSLMISGVQNEAMEIWMRKDIANIANRNVGIIFRTFTYLDPEMFKNLYTKA